MAGYDAANMFCRFCLEKVDSISSFDSFSLVLSTLLKTLHAHTLIFADVESADFSLLLA